MKHHRKHFEPIRLELNKDASSVLVLVAIGCFIMSAALVLHLFIDILE